MGDLVWLYTPVVKSGHTKKFSRLWHGPYTVIDRLSSYNYRVQLVGTTRTLVVHRNRLKRYYGGPPQTPPADRDLNSNQKISAEVEEARVGGYTGGHNEMWEQEVDAPLTYPTEDETYLNDSDVDREDGHQIASEYEEDSTELASADQTGEQPVPDEDTPDEEPSTSGRPRRVRFQRDFGPFVRH